MIQQTDSRVNFNQVPADLRELKQWVLWKYETRDGKATKVPYSVSGAKAKADDPSTWGTFQQAVDAYQADPERWAGIGFEFSADDDLVGIDLDSVLDPTTGEFLEWPESFTAKCDCPGAVPSPRRIVEAFGSYAETSPSGTGVKVWLKGVLPQGGNRKNGDANGDRKAAGIELYSSGRYFTVTGQRLPTSPPTITEANGTLSHLHRLIFGHKEEATAKQKKGKGRRRKQATTPENLDDAKIIELASRAKNGAAFNALWQGDVSGYPSESEADLALANHIAFYCGADTGRIETLMRQSGLNREKWDRHATYLADTIAKSLEGRTEFYKGRKDTVSAEEVLKALREIANGVQVGENEKQFLTIAQILQHIAKKTDGWPRRVGQDLFIHDRQHGICFLPKVSSLFGWLGHTVGPVRWYKGASAVGQAEVYAELIRTAQSYHSVEELPHEPPMQGHYYACESIPPGEGKALTWLIDRFCPATDYDRELIRAAFLTPLWGGPCGCRPCFPVTSDDGRGAGKTALTESIGSVYNGILQFSAMEDIGTIKTRLLSPDAQTKRVAGLDNVKSHKLSWGELEGLITASTIGGRRLYTGEASRPNSLTWLLTMNGASLSTDMAQRSIIIKIQKPERSATWAEETRQFIESHREAIIGDMIAALRGPQTPLAKFSRWASWEREILQRLPNPNELQQVILERQAVVDVDAEESSIIQDFFADQLRWLNYDPDTERVFIPSQVAARWFCWATNQKVGVASASRQLKQLATEKGSRLEIPGRSWGRGFCWAGPQWNLTHTATDLLERLREKASPPMESSSNEF